jgi:predicted RecB family nuclease
MSAKITREVIESHLRCKYKAHLLRAGEHGIQSDHEALLAGQLDRARLLISDRILAGQEQGAVLRGVPLDATALASEPSFLLDPTYEDDLVCLPFDGLKKTPGPSSLGDFHYVPLLFLGRQLIRTQDRILLAVFALLLSRLQGFTPSTGLIWHGENPRPTTVPLGPNREKAAGLLQELARLHRSDSTPRLILNDHCEVCEFRQRCHRQAVQEDNLSLLRGLGDKEIRNLARKGILTLSQLAYTFRPRRKGKRQQARSDRRFRALQALALRDKKTFVLGTPSLPASPVHVYLDLEGLPDEGFVYLIGLVIVSHDLEERHTFWADSRDQEAVLYEQLLDVLERHPQFLVLCYGSYEKLFLQRMRQRTTRKELADKVLQALVNVLSLVYAHIYFPTYSNGLKEVGGYLGCSWTEPNASGAQSIVWRTRWQTTRDGEWKGKLITYNLEDCAALRRVTETIQAIIARDGSSTGSAPDSPGVPPLAFVKDIDKLARERKWRKGYFVHADYEFINSCAYFDYQRERVFVRTGPGRRKRAPRREKSRNHKVRVSVRVLSVCQACPYCASKSLTFVRAGQPTACREPRVKRAFDLVITPAGIRRRVIESRTRRQKCRACGKVFVSELHKRLDRHFHGLKSWAMYQHVAHRLSLDTLGTLFEEFFGLRIAGAEVHVFKTLMARYYRTTYERLLEKLLAGGLLHVDETEVILRTGKAYVWVFTNLEEVVFLLRPTREGDFLKDLLKDFHGVLVSDFYAAYGSIPCPQQKCLIHLIRDINQDLLNHPFDEELQAITRPFGTLLRAIVTTIDRHGLKRRHLERHERDVEEFFRQLDRPPFCSEAAEALRTRLNKHRDKLFTFLKYDGVPWNNNNAENAIKRFVPYREANAGVMKEAGLTEYLVLLSLCQTCRYKGVSFLKFLLSKELDIDRFREKRRERRPFVIETYPAGFVWGRRTAKQPEPETAAQGHPSPAESGLDEVATPSPPGNEPAAAQPGPEEMAVIAEIARKVAAGEVDPRLRWSRNGRRVRVLFDKAFPNRAVRGAMLHGMLDDRLAAIGWFWAFNAVVHTYERRQTIEERGAAVSGSVAGDVAGAEAGKEG